MWKWEPARTSFLIRSAYDMLPSAANLIRWGVSEDDKCKYGQYRHLRHTLSNCELRFKGGKYTWRHDQLLRVISKALEQNVSSINEGKLSQQKVLKEVRFHPEGGRCSKNVGLGIVKMRDKRWY